MKTLTAKELALYLECECTTAQWFLNDTGSRVLIGMDIETGEVRVKLDRGAFWLPARDVKPILRPLSDMTEQEKNEYNMMQPDLSGLWINLNAKRTVWALSKHFDLFGWIEQGLAIDKSTLTSSPSK